MTVYSRWDAEIPSLEMVVGNHWHSEILLQRGESAPLNIFPSRSKFSVSNVRVAFGKSATPSGSVKFPQLSFPSGGRMLVKGSQKAEFQRLK